MNESAQDPRIPAALSARVERYISKVISSPIPGLGWREAGLEERCHIIANHVASVGKLTGVAPKVCRFTWNQLSGAYIDQINIHLPCWAFETTLSTTHHELTHVLQHLYADDQSECADDRRRVLETLNSSYNTLLKSYAGYLDLPTERQANETAGRILKGWGLAEKIEFCGGRSKADLDHWIKTARVLEIRTT